MTPCTARVTGRHRSEEARNRCPRCGTGRAAHGAIVVSALPPAAEPGRETRGLFDVPRDDRGHPLLVDWENLRFDDIFRDEYGQTLGDDARGPEFSRRAIVTYAADLHLVVTITSAAKIENFDDGDDPDPADTRAHAMAMSGEATLCSDAEDPGGTEIDSDYWYPDDPDTFNTTLDGATARARKAIEGDAFFGYWGPDRELSLERTMRNEVFERQLKARGVDPRNAEAIAYLEGVSGHEGWPLEVSAEDGALAVALHPNP